MASPPKITWWICSVVGTYAFSFAYLRWSAGADAPPSVVISTADEEKLQIFEDTVNRSTEAMALGAAQCADSVAKMQTAVNEIPIHEYAFGAATGLLLSNAQLLLKDARQLEIIQSNLGTEMRQLAAVERGLRAAEKQSDLFRLLNEVERANASLADPFDQARLSVSRTKLALGVDPARLAEAARSKLRVLQLENLQHETRLFDQKHAHTEIGSGVKVLRIVIERSPVTYHTLKFPW